jgi:hypothetical protein
MTLVEIPFIEREPSPQTATGCASDQTRLCCGAAWDGRDEPGHDGKGSQMAKVMTAIAPRRSDKVVKKRN